MMKFTSLCYSVIHIAWESNIDCVLGRGDNIKIKHEREPLNQEVIRSTDDETRCCYLCLFNSRFCSLSIWRARHVWSWSRHVRGFRNVWRSRHVRRSRNVRWSRNVRSWFGNVQSIVRSWFIWYVPRNDGRYDGRTLSRNDDWYDTLCWNWFINIKQPECTMIFWS